MGRTRRLGAGHDAAFLPEGIAQPLPKHSNLVVQLHLHPSGKAELEDGQLAIYFAKTPPKKSLTGIQVPPMFGFAAGIDIPAGESAFTITDSFTLPVDVEAFGARGHAHYLAREMKMTATLPDGSTKGTALDQGLGLRLAGLVFLQDAVRAAEGHDAST